MTPSGAGRSNGRGLLANSRTQFLLSFLGAFLLFGLTPKTPDFGWMGTYVAPAFPGLDTGIPVLRLWIPIERLEYTLLGTQWWSQNLPYALIFGWLFYVVLRDAIRFGTTMRFLALLVPMTLAVFFAAYGGALYDAVFSLGLLQSLRTLEKLTVSSGWKQLVIFGIWLAVLDWSHPNAIVYVAIFTIVAFARVRAVRSLILVSPLALLAGPFHLIQYLRYGTWVLTTYQGQNLAEAFKWQGPFAVTRDCLTELGRRQIDSLAFQQCSDSNQHTIYGLLLSDPLNIRYVLSTHHILEVVIPTPLWGAGNQITIVWLALLANWTVRVALLAVLVFWVTQANRSFRYLIGSLVVILGFVTTIVAHNGTESMRLIAPYYFVLFWILMRPKKQKPERSVPA